ncbi:penicillin-binding transpeptidase domain-containing protein [Nocardioides sp.]|uniref:penicillin-binding transpeptidase domain-containing protein n=1 Tax=Nocardioides sp. TaxID=35761 RepID=UPI00262C1521|nr:penicillin-binding transpeptidase domain-containing protein [Nocardioides sp.]MCW2739184.1 penicillin-binding protein [Nocardioides sp.]
MVSSLALLRSGLTVDDVVSCPATTVVDGRSFKNYDDYPPSAIGDIPFVQAIAQSCNTALIGNAGRLAPGDLAAAAGALGLGTDHDLGFPVYFGQVPPPGTETGAAADMIGQGTVLASPFAMATVAASVSSGRAVLPVLLPGHQVEQARVVVPLTDAEARTLRGLMRAVVTTGSGRFLLDVPGQVGAKTGTAEYGEPDAAGTLPTHAWMIATRGDLAVAVFVETGVSGSQTAGPVLEAFLR